MEILLHTNKQKEAFPRLKVFNMFGMGQYEKVGDTAKVNFYIRLCCFFSNLSVSLSLSLSV